MAVKDAQVLQPLFGIVLRGEKDEHVVISSRDALGNPGELGKEWVGDRRNDKTDGAGAPVAKFYRAGSLVGLVVQLPDHGLDPGKHFWSDPETRR